MNRRLTNAIRFLMDECLPPLLRDCRLFMWPFFYLAYGGRQINEVMEFKSRVRNFTQEQYRDFYTQLDSISRRRATDLNQPCIDAMLAALAGVAPESLLDMGCGHGYFLQLVQRRYPHLILTGCDVTPRPSQFGVDYLEATIEDLPDTLLPRDVVTCSHTLEHVLDLPLAMHELRRLARKLLIIVVPCQRYFYYTLDEHLHFFPDRSSLYFQLGVKDDEVRLCTKLSGDWLLVLRGGAA